MRAVFAWGMAAAIATALLFGVAAVLQAVGARDVPSISEHPWREVLSRAVRSKVLMAVLSMHVFGGVLHLLSAVWLPLYLAQAVMASSVVVTAFYAAHLLGEHLRLHQRLAVLATVGGLVLLTVGAGSAGKERVTEHFLWILVVVLVMGTLAATFAVASSSRSAAITLAAVDTLRADHFTRATTWLAADHDALRGFLTSAGWSADGAHRTLDLTGDGSTLVKQVRLHTRIAG